MLFFSLAYSSILSLICVVNYDSFAYFDFDLALNMQKYWNIIHGEGRMTLIGGVSVWGNSLEIIAYPLSVLYLLLFSSAKALLIMQSFAIGLSAIPLFLIARKYLPDKIAVCIAVAYLLNPATWYINLYEYHEIVFCLPALLFAFYFLKRERFGLFVSFAALSLICRADVALVILMFGVYALMERRSAKWAIAPISLSAIWIILGVFILIPMAGGKVRYEVFYSDFGSNFAGIAKNMLLHPLEVLKAVFIKENGILIFQLLFPAGFLSVLGLKELLICIISFFQHAVSLRPEEHMIYYHYTATIIPFIYISAASGLSRIKGPRGVKTAAFSLIILPLIANFLYGPLSAPKDILPNFRYADFNRLKEGFVRGIPKGSAVMGSFEFLSHLANRRSLYSFHYIVRGETADSPLRSFEAPDDLEYALINFVDNTVFHFWNDDSDIRVRRFLEDGDWVAEDSFDTTVLLKKKGNGDNRLFQADVAGFDDSGPIIKIGDKLALLRYSAKRQGRYIEMSFLWQCLEPVTDEVWVYFQIIDKGGRELHNSAKPVCYGIYPVKRWKKSEKVMDYYRMFLPDKIKSGREYDIRMTLFLRDSGRALVATKVRDADINDRFALLLGTIRY